MFKSFSMELAGRTLTVEVGRVAKQANVQHSCTTAIQLFFHRNCI